MGKDHLVQHARFCKYLQHSFPESRAAMISDKAEFFTGEVWYELSSGNTLNSKHKKLF